ncbi:MAG TPA: prepilin-type N-terminal cleavage/methylation domain-containing protein [Gammaproteobacteria bacterium]|nr:prepilin-type N-terminal cleavage/methylation domain-containing protein [Gammaproteobacteria bacterium]
MNMKPSQQRGLTLIELMVALVISLLILAGLFTVYKSNQHANRLNEGLTRTQENGRFAVDFLGRDIRQAGFPASDANVQKFLFFGSLNDVAVANNPYPSDVLALRHGTTGLLTADCAGNTPGNVDTANSLPNTSLNIYDIRDTGRLNNRGKPIFALFCNGAELVEGIQNMQVLYGVDTDFTRDYIANQYVTASAVPDLDGDQKPDWFRVVSLRIALLASSVDERASAPSPRTFDLLGTTLGPYTDKEIRRVYTTTILIRNNMAPTP